LVMPLMIRGGTPPNNRAHLPPTPSRALRGKRGRVVPAAAYREASVFIRRETSSTDRSCSRGSTLPSCLAVAGSG
jgi:hypothetical protein